MNDINRMDTLDHSNANASLVVKILKPLASLRLTVTLFVLSLFLVFFGTLAQMDAGIWTVMDQYFRSSHVWVPLQLLVKFAQKFFYVNETFQLSGSFLFPGGWLLGGLMLANLIAAHMLRFQFTWKRSGILMIHSGMILLMLGELVTGLYSVESKMIIRIGESSNYVEQTGDCELVIKKEANAEKGDLIVTIPGSMLRKGGTITDDRLPVNIEVLEYHKNSDIRTAGADEEGVTAHTGIRFKVIPSPEDSGVTSEARENVPLCKVNLLNKETGEVIAKKDLSVFYSHSRIGLRFEQSFKVDEQTYPIELRFKRVYKPYTIHLINFEHKKYPGTDKPKDFASTVQLIDPSRFENREVRIWMNNPLRHSGDTFYQSSFLQGNSGTVLQVVRNPGALIPYISCAMVSIGLIVHFWMSAAFRNAMFRLKQSQVRSETQKQDWERYLVIGLIGLAVIGLMMTAIPPKAADGEYDLYTFGQIPVQDGGRVKPIDTFARTALTSINERSSVTIGEGKEKTSIPAIKWMLDTMVVLQSDVTDAEHYRVFRIVDAEILDKLKLERRDGLRYSISDFETPINEAEKQETIQRLKEEIKQPLSPEEMERMVGKAIFTKRLEPLKQEVDRISEIPSKDRSVYEAKVMELANRIQLFMSIASWASPAILPPPGKNMEDWQPLRLVMAHGGQNFHLKEASQLTSILKAYVNKDPSRFNKEVATYLAEIQSKGRSDTKALGLEAWMNHFAPFYKCALLFAVVLMICIASWLIIHEPLRQAAFWLSTLALVIHTIAMIARMYIQDRPPITNLYSTAIFIGWMAVPLCLFMESKYRNGVATFVSAVLGGITMVIAHHLEQQGDTLEMMQAVLDTNFWLATHVTSINLGYMATFVSGLVGVYFILAGLFTKSIDRDDTKRLGQMMYLTVCLSMFLSFTGTVLGGIWADQSWGRFWGWDPKENGALLIVIWMATILHARWCGLIKERGMAICGVLGNMITVWSWFGTNQLGVGLHAYGFNKELADGCTASWIGFTTVALLGCLPVTLWRSSIYDAASTPPADNETTAAKLANAARRSEAAKNQLAKKK